MARQVTKHYFYFVRRHAPTPVITQHGTTLTGNFCHHVPILRASPRHECGMCTTSRDGVGTHDNSWYGSGCDYLPGRRCLTTRHTIEVAFVLQNYFLQRNLVLFTNINLDARLRSAKHCHTRPGTPTRRRGAALALPCGGIRTTGGAVLIRPPRGCRL